MDQGFEPGKLDGVIGWSNTSSHWRVSAGHNLPVTGSVDPQTAEELGVIIVEISPIPGGESLPPQDSSSSENIPSATPAQQQN